MLIAVLLVVFALLLRGSLRKYWIVFLYVSWELLSNVGLAIFDATYGGSAVGPFVTQDARILYARLYWSNDVMVDVLRFVLVIVLTYRAVDAGAKRVQVGRLLALVMTVVFVLPFLVFPMGNNAWPKGAWFNSTSELLNFGAAIMNLILWGALLSNRRRDNQLAAVSVGLGIVVTGAAFSYGVRHFLPVDSTAIPNLFLMLSQLAGWTIWCRAFWPASEPRRVNALAR